MGQAKNEMMRLEALPPMLDWIEDNYGIEAGEEGSEEWEEAVLAFESHCENQRLIEEAHYRQGELEWLMYLDSPLHFFRLEIKSVEELLEVSVIEETKFSLWVMLHAHVIASIESYLAALFIGKVIGNEELMRKLVESDPEFSKIKFTMREIYEKADTLKFTVAQYLKDLIFHDLKKVKPMFKEVLGCDFGNIEWLFKAISIRHHCVHRVGMDKDGNRVELSKNSIQKLIRDSIDLVMFIERYN